MTSFSRVSGFVVLNIVIIATFWMKTAMGAEVSAYSLSEQWYMSGSEKRDEFVLDSINRHLFVSHGDHVDVIDIDHGKKIAAIGSLSKAQGIAFVPGASRGFVADGPAQRVISFDIGTLNSFAMTMAHKGPKSVVYDPFSLHVFVGNYDSRDVTVIDGMNGLTIGQVDLLGRPGPLISDGQGSIYIGLEDKSQIAVLDAGSLKVRASYDVQSVCLEPKKLAMDVKTGRLFVACTNHNLVVVDIRDGKILNAFALDSDAIAFDAEQDLLFSANRDGMVVSIMGTKDGVYRVHPVVRVPASAEFLAIDPITHILYVAALGNSREGVPLQKLEADKSQGLSAGLVIFVIKPAIP